MMYQTERDAAPAESRNEKKKKKKKQKETLLDVRCINRIKLYTREFDKIETETEIRPNFRPRLQRFFFFFFALYGPLHG